MKIIAENLGKKFRNEWIFRRFSQQFEIGNDYTIIGQNGSGKSTLLQVISSYIPNNEGIIRYSDSNNKAIEIGDIYKSIAIATPYLELIEDFTLIELVTFHSRLKPLANQLNPKKFIEFIDFKQHSEKQIKFFSSGMRQKLKLGLCIFAQEPILLLDEPTTNLDIKTKEWFLENINFVKQNKLIILASNDPFEYSFSKNIIDIQQFK
jgi:ABC-type multidrug transport system ATPase subunit